MAHLSLSISKIVDTQSAIILLQQQVAALEDADTQLLGRITVLEVNDDIANQRFAELEMTTNATNQELANLEGDLQGKLFNLNTT